MTAGKRVRPSLKRRRMGLRMCAEQAGNRERATHEVRFGACNADESSVRDDPADSRAGETAAARPGNRQTKPRRGGSAPASALKQLQRAPETGARIQRDYPACFRRLALQPVARRGGLMARVRASGSSGRRAASAAGGRPLRVQRGRRACASAMTSQFSRWSAQASAISSPIRASQPADSVERSEVLDVCMTKPHIGGELGITLIIAKHLRFVKCDFVI